MKKYKKSRVFIIILIIILLISSAALAYRFNTLEAKDNVFTSSSEIWAELTEPNWEGEKALTFVPGMIVRKDPMLTNLSEDKDVYGAIRISFQYENGEAMDKDDRDKLILLLAIDWNVGEEEREWSRVIDETMESSPASIFIYNKKLEPGEVSVPLFNAIKMNTESEGLKEEDLRWLQKVKVVDGEMVYDSEEGIGKFNIIADGAVVHASVYDSVQEAVPTLVGLFP